MGSTSGEDLVSKFHGAAGSSARSCLRIARLGLRLAPPVMPRWTCLAHSSSVPSAIRSSISAPIVALLLAMIASPMLAVAEPTGGRPPKHLTIETASHYWAMPAECRGEEGMIVNGWLYRVRKSDASKLRRVHPQTARYVLGPACAKLLCHGRPQTTCVMRRPDEYWR